MTPAADHQPDPAQPDVPAVHPRTRSMESWRARKAVMASRGETDGPRVAECDSALWWWRHRTYMIRDIGITEERAEELLELVRQPENQAETETAEAEAVTR